MKQRMPLFVLSFCFLTICTIVFFAMPQKQIFAEPNEMLAVFLGEEKAKTFPTKDSGYVYDRIECTNDEEAAWNADTWKLTISKIKKETKCNVYFAVAFTEQEFAYSGETKEFIVPKTGNYKLEVWGAQGGDGKSNADGTSDLGGKGGYSVGTVFLEANTKMFVNVGGKGETIKGGFNGGGNGGATDNNRAAGGGATDIRIGDNTLYHRVIVAGGGGGMLSGFDRPVGAGGGTTGGNGGINWHYGYGASQIAGGSYSSSTAKAGSFGYGGSEPNGSSYCGGGGGWYGGQSGNGAGGGSGWVYTEETFRTWQTANPSDATYWELDTKYYLTEAETIAGNQSVPTHDGTSTMTGNSENGFAKITLIS